MDTIESYDFIIVGAGPAGLTAAISAAQKGFSAIVLEKAEIAAPHPRGESFRENPFLTELLGSSFFKKHCYETPGNSVYHSPEDLQQFTLYGKKPLYFFEWRDLIERLTTLAWSSRVEVRFQSRVIGLIKDERGISVGVSYLDHQNGTCDVRGKVIIAADGYQSTLGKSAGVSYDEMFCPMVKCLARNINYDFSQLPELQFYLIGNGDLPISPRFPQTVAYMFPLDHQKAELGMMLRLGQSHKMKKTLERPSKEHLLEVWNYLKSDYPGFSQYFKGADIELEASTGLSNARMVDQFIPSPGVILVGDAAGFIDPFGSSGLYSGMRMASHWIDILADKLVNSSESSTQQNVQSDLWSQTNIREYQRRFKNTPIYQKIKSSYRLISKFEWYVFKHLRTGKKINKRWPMISWMMKKT